MIMNASAVGYYGSSFDIVNESSSAGTDFLSNICLQWEKKAEDELSNKTQQLILLRIGVVLDSKSGMLSKLIMRNTLQIQLSYQQHIKSKYDESFQQYYKI